MSNQAGCLGSNISRIRRQAAATRTLSEIISGVDAQLGRAVIKPSNLPSKHHFIPIFYLNLWTGDDGKLERYTRPIPSKVDVKRVFPSAIGWKRDLYASPGHRLGDQWLETDIFQTIDSRAARALAKLNGDDPTNISAEDRSAWIVFIRSLYHRSPDNYASTIATGVQVYERALDEAADRYDALKREGDPATYEEYRASITVEQRRYAVQGMLPDIIANPRMGQFLMDLHTRLLVLPDDAPDFLLSDDPLARTNGLMKREGHIAIPLSPRRLFLSAWDEGTLEQITTMEASELVASVNRWCVESARNFIIARDRAQRQFIESRFGANPVPPLMRPAATNLSV